jgi:diaminohydroxyphosphoribosylaminopyrimidine deaminase/5-amino-6-(5-phosphoribosylamino)uracil reductase
MAEDILKAKGVEVFRVEGKDGRLDLAAVLKTLADRGITRLMVEGGPTVAASFVEADLVDEAVLLRGEKPIGATGINPLEKMPLEALTGRLAARGSERLDADTIESFVRV